MPDKSHFSAGSFFSRRKLQKSENDTQIQAFSLLKQKTAFQFHFRFFTEILCGFP